MSLMTGEKIFPPKQKTKDNKMLEISIYTSLATIFMVIGLVMLYKIFIKRPDEIFINEAKRGLLENFEEEDAHSSNGRLFKRGMSITKTNDGIKITPQKKLTDIGLLA